MRDWYVIVDGVIIGTVAADCFELATHEALSRYGRMLQRGNSKAKAIFTDDSFKLQEVIV